MKNYKYGIILGIVSILCTLAFTGIPFGNNTFEILTLLFFIIGLLLIIYFGLIKKNSKKTLITSLIYSIILLLLVGFIEMKYKNFSLLAIGFIPGLIISIIAILLSKDNKQKYKTKISIVLNIIGLLLSIFSLLLVIPNGGFIIR